MPGGKPPKEGGALVAGGATADALIFIPGGKPLNAVCGLLVGAGKGVKGPRDAGSSVEGANGEPDWSGAIDPGPRLIFAVGFIMLTP